MKYLILRVTRRIRIFLFFIYRQVSSTFLPNLSRLLVNLVFFILFCQVFLNFSVILVESAKSVIDFFNTITLYVGEGPPRPDMEGQPLQDLNLPPNPPLQDLNLAPISSP